MSQILIKIVLIVAFGLLALYLIAPISGQRGLAIRKIVYLLLFAGAALAVLFPSWISQLARSLGIGRGTDLLLYGLIVVFLGVSFSLRRKIKMQEVAITELARSIAIDNPRLPGASDASSR
ncbi:DUF2304 domain-containing protein [Pseudoclavibacter caeni]|uniref:DUF2304 domain-containing protein n=1 Tax=Pseudoclavibacter caeni TaxID=908846 RepID=A0A7C8FLS2_9MICO|nr:DUF2304 domain-containing protein [Pseudoclavibacter caeni]KAB1633633.1 DUF2304 domain-containing protein [Pseudoclavibacter caeni]NYJ96352.1 hypothetical protein [Pseudoclavibacter caeni]